MTRRVSPWLRGAVVALAWYWSSCALQQSVTAGAQPADSELGRQIFNHNWARPGELDRSLGEGGDGLGPLFNDVSCAACHALGGSGGAGANDKNAILLSFSDEIPAGRRARVALVNRAKNVHFQFAETTSIVLHKFGLGLDDAPYEFDEWRANLLAPTEYFDESAGVSPVRIRANGVNFEVAQRNTPALWGLGIIEASAGLVTPARTACSLFREELRDRQQLETPWITGRIPRTSTGQEGWFGWRGQTDTLHGFVLNACAHELGLEVPRRSQPASPTLSTRERQAQEKQRGLDLTDYQCRSLTAFVEELPRPRLVLPDSRDEVARVLAGEQIFDRAGCADCHVPEFAGITGFYSDLLLHDMGESLADRASAQPERRRGFSGGRGGYSGGSSSFLVRIPGLPCDCEREWKTPPLWGVADSAPYLHDGRAASLEDAILMHDGEAAPSRYAYEILSEAEQWNLLAFLESLRSPLHGVSE